MKTNGVYATTDLRDPYIYTMSLIAMLYRENKCTHFKDAWFPLAYTVVTIGGFTKWVTILSHSLNRMIEKI